MTTTMHLTPAKFSVQAMGLLFLVSLIIGCDSAVNTAVDMVVDVEVAVEPNAVREEFESTFQLQVPESHKGGIKLEISVFGAGLNFHSLIPKAADASEIFEGGNSIKYSPGPHTIVVGTVTKGRNADKKLNRALLRSLNSDKDLKKVHIQAGTKKIAAYEKSLTSFGQENLTLQILLDGGRNLVIIGPKATFDHEFKTQFASALAAGHPANEQLYSHVTTPPLNPNAACGLGELPDGFEVQLVHVERGVQELTGQTIDPREVESYLQPVSVGATDKPVVLVLMAGEPTVWQLGQTTNSKLAGVLATGRHTQRVIGLPANIPLLETASRSSGACEAFYVDQRQLDNENYPDQIWETFAQDPRQLHRNQKPSGFVIGTLDSTVNSDATLTLQDVLLDPNKQLLPGTLGIAQLLEKGTLTRASIADFELWLQSSKIVDDKKKTKRARQRISTESQRDKFYVINKSTELPLGMGGSQSMQFVAAAGVDTIPGDISHNTIYFADGRCKGPACPR